MTDLDAHIPTAAGAARRRPGLFDRLRSLAALARSRRHLARLDAAALTDIGVDRTESFREARRPFWDAPSTWIERPTPARPIRKG